MWEDLGATTIKSLMSTKGELSSTKKAMDDIKNTKYDDLGSSLQQLGRMFKDEILTPIAEHITPKLQEFVNYVITNFSDIKQSVIDIANAFDKWSPAIAAVATALAGIGIIGLINNLSAIGTAMATAITSTKLWAAAQWLLNTAMDANPVALVITGLVALGVAFAVLWNKSDAFREFWIGLWETIKSGCSTAINAIGKFFTETLPQFIETAVNFFKELPGKIWTWLVNTVTKVMTWRNNMIAKAKDVATNFITTIINFVKDLPSKIWTWLVNVVTKVMTWRNNMIAKAKDVASNFISNIINFIKDLPSKIWSFLVNVVTKVATWQANMVAKAILVGTNFVTNVINFIKDLPSKIWTFLVNVVTKVVTWGVNLAAKGKEAATKLFNSIVNKIKEIPGKMLSIGSDIVKGLWNGINNMTSWIADKIKGFGSAVTEGLKDFFGIHSPSTLMRDEIGKWLPKGLAVGIDENAKSVISSMKNLASNAVGAMQSGLTTTKVTGEAAGTSGTSIINNFNQTINSPKQLSRLEIYRQSRNLFNFAGGVS